MPTMNSYEIFTKRLKEIEVEDEKTPVIFDLGFGQLKEAIRKASGKIRRFYIQAPRGKTDNMNTI